MNANSLDLQDYLDSTSDSSNRTRTVAIVLLVASVLALVGFLNSFKFGWMLQRLHTIEDPHSGYITEKLGSNHDNEQYKQFYTAVAKAYVDNALTIRVPFFGFAFDVNDLGLLGGIGFIAILSLLLFSLRSEFINLRLAFKAAAKKQEQLPIFYDLLAMRQVFTLPHVEDKEKLWQKKPWWLWSFIPKAICFLPSLVYTLILIHDCWLTKGTGELISDPHTEFLLVYTVSFWVIILVLAIWCSWRWVTIDDLWKEYWQDVMKILGPENVMPEELSPEEIT
jgi:hypothetical protein